MSARKWMLTAFLLSAYFFGFVLIPLFLALFLAMLLEPFVKSLMQMGLSRTTSSVFVVSGFALLGAVTIWLSYLAMLDLSSAVPVFVEKMNGFLLEFSKIGNRFEFGPKPDAKIPLVQVVQTYPEWSRYVLTSLGGLYEAISILVFVPLLLFYFLVDKENMTESFNILNGRMFYIPKLHSELPRMLRIFFAANLLTGASLIFMHAPLLFALGFENWVSLALLTGPLNLLPVVGGPLSIFAVMVLGLGPAFHLPLFLGLSIGMLGLHFVANNVLLPWLVGTRVNINAVALIVGILFWSWIWGAPGFFLAVPMTLLIKILLECSVETYPLANLMAARPRTLMPGSQA